MGKIQQNISLTHLSLLRVNFSAKEAYLSSPVRPNDPSGKAH